MRNAPGGLWFIVVMMAILDIYVFQVIRMVSQHSSSRLKLVVFGVYWLISIGAMVLMILLPYINHDAWNKSIRNTIFATIVGLFFAKLVASLFFLIDDVRRVLTWLITRFVSNPSFTADDAAAGITRSAFLSWLGLGMGGGLFGTMLYGFSNKYRYQVKRVKLSFPNLPAAFKGFKIVQISDVHSGSLTDKTAVLKGIEKILNEKADIIVFTGDLVNDKASEMDNYMDVFSRLQAPYGVYSVLGNHDYGDYVKWESPDSKQANLEKMYAVHKELGWKLLMNEHVVLEKGPDAIALIGIENWGAKARFPKYGRMSDGYRGTESYPFKILLSHDPSHWDAEVRTKYPDIDLTLAGHTHGMQFGLELPGFKWSPVQYMYKQWGGIYEEGSQKLYVNTGFGFIGYPGRVGILPEITVIELV